MPRLFITGIILFLLFGAGYGLSQAARSIPWDCSDWQPFAHDDRTTAILETLAENRGKTLYCGIDQSDTFAKAETWAAGKDRNERDDTVYWGERGSFRGFIAAQEGWLTDGESGITGQSIATIFEFPKEEKRRVTRVKRRKVSESAAPIVRALNGPYISAGGGSEGFARRNMRHSYWNGVTSDDPRKGNTAAKTAYWTELAEPIALAYCRARGYTRLTQFALGDLPVNFILSDSNDQTHQGWGYAEFSSNSGAYNGRAYQFIRWSGTCEKKVRRTRR